MERLVAARVPRAPPRVLWDRAEAAAVGCPSPSCVPQAALIQLLKRLLGPSFVPEHQSLWIWACFAVQF